MSTRPSARRSHKSKQQISPDKTAEDYNQNDETPFQTEKERFKNTNEKNFPSRKVVKRLKVELHNLSENETQLGSTEDSDLSSDEIDSDEDDAGEKLLHKHKLSLQKKLKMIQNLNIKTMAVDLKQKTTKSSALPKAVSKIKIEKKKALNTTPQRFSARIRNKEPIVLNEDQLTLQSEAVAVEKKRGSKPESYEMIAIGYGESDNEIENEAHNYFMHETLKTSENKIEPKMNTSKAEFKRTVKDLKITELSNKKVVPKRIFSMAFHERTDNVIVAAGDKEGYLGIWDVNNTKDSNGGVYHFRPHSSPISCVKFSQDPNKLFLCSYDGVLRYADLNTSFFSEAIVDSEFHPMTSFDFLSQNNDSCLVASTYNGDILVIDRRESKNERIRQFSSFNKAAKTVSVHPTESHYIAVAHLKGVLNFFDLRKFKLGSNKCVPLASVEAHTSSVNSAYFNPHHGNRVVTCGYDDKVKIFDTEIISQESVKLVGSVNHDNHTGRFLTPFRTTWHPFQKDVFAIGSKHRPYRRIELFDSNLDMVCTLRDDSFLVSINSVIAFHPTQNIIAGGNSSGKVHVFQ